MKEEAMRTTAVKYKDVDALAIENNRLRLVVLPGVGAKLASLVDLESGFEFFTQRDGGSYRLQPYAGDYLLGECSGVDDMFPTIDAYHYESYPWKGVELPDHGEVWSLPWNVRDGGGRLELFVHGVRLPYELRKAIYFISERTVRIDYEAINRSIFPMDFLWASHMMLTVEEGARIRLPDGANRGIVTSSKNGELGSYGEEFSWPDAKDGLRLDAMRGRERDNIHKYYLKQPLSAGWCALDYPSRGLSLRLAFPVDRIPYLALLHNEGGSHDRWGADYYNFFFEPCTAPMDRPDVARLYGRGSVLRAGGTYAWSLDITVDRAANAGG